MTEGTLTTIPLDQLMLSKLNARETDRAADVASMAESIAVHGLKQNLIVVPAHFVSGEPGDAQLSGEPLASGGKNVWQDRFEVIAGARRFQAMQLLVQQDRLSPTYPVPCMVEDRDQAAETSLLENIERVAMNPADEFKAFATIVARHSARPELPDANAIEICAKRFGTTVKHVQGRLRLAALAPDILEALRTNAIGVESAKAYAGVEDHALQLKVFAAQSKSTYQPHNPQSVRQALRGETVPLTNALVKFVGVDAYVAAGGRMETEMFMGTEGEERIADAKLLQKLASEKAEPLVGPAAKKDGFKSGLLATGAGKWDAKWPKDPKGMERVQSWHSDPDKAAKKKCVGVYAIDGDGKGIERIGSFRPEEAKPEPTPRRDWAAEYAAEQREARIEARAARMALPTFNGTAFEGRTSWPDEDQYNCVEDDHDDENSKLVLVFVRVPVAEIDGNKAEAERLVDEEAAAEAEAARMAELDRLAAGALAQATFTKADRGVSVDEEQDA